MDRNTKPIVEVYAFQELLPYVPVWELQKKWVREIDDGVRKNSLLLLQHFPTYTIGREGKEEHILFDREKYLAQGGELVYVDRGGDVTYHGPGQIVGYPLLELSRYRGGPHQYLRDIEEVIIRTLSRYGIQGERKSPYTGVWVQDRKICAIGVKFNRGVKKRQFITSHGFALNVNCDLSMFKKIIPCGIRQYPVTSMSEISGANIDVQQLSLQIVEQFAGVFGMDPRIKNPVLIF